MGDEFELVSLSGNKAHSLSNQQYFDLGKEVTTHKQLQWYDVSVKLLQP